MTPNELNNILSLIAAAIFADDHVYASEIEAFSKATSKLKFAQKTTPKLSEAKLLAWYDANKDTIKNSLSTPYFKDWFYALLKDLKDFPEKKAILDVMREISYADGEVHINERALTSLAANFWGLS